MTDCLICNRATTSDSPAESESTTDPICVKLEPGFAPEVIMPDNTLNSAARTNLGTFCKLLKLSGTCTSALLEDLPFIAGSTSAVFCDECRGTIKGAEDLLEQLRELETQINGCKSQVEEQIHRCFSDHISAAGGSGRQRQAPHTCKGIGRRGAPKCSAVERFRELIVTEIREKAVSLIGIEAETGPQPTPGNQGPKQQKQSRTGLINLNRKRKVATKASAPATNKTKRRSIPSVEDAEVILGLEDPDDGDDDDPSYDPLDAGTGHQLESGSECEPTTKEQFGNFKLKPCSIDIEKIKVEGPPKANKMKKKVPASTALAPTRSPIIGSARRRPGRPRLPKKPKKRSMGPFNCTECSAVFTLENYLQYHYKKMHGKTQFDCMCSKCGKRFYTKQTLATHLQVQGGECGKSQFPDSVTVQLEHGSAPFRCKICGLETKRRSFMLLHDKTHTKEKAHMCEICGDGFKIKESLTRHKIMKHTDPNGPHPFACKRPGCERFFPTAKLLGLHEMNHQNEFKYHCDQCTYKTNHLSSFTTHRQCVHECIRNYPCPHCDKAYKKSTQLKKHVYSVHTAPEDRPFKCATCGKTFSEKFTLDRHEIIHTNQKPIQCKICGRRFAVHDYLRIHMKGVHAKERKTTKEQAAAGESKEPTPEPDVKMQPGAEAGQPEQVVIIHGP